MAQHFFDWREIGRPRPTSVLRRDWQILANGIGKAISLDAVQ
jgi:hypothetical protein